MSIDVQEILKGDGNTTISNPPENFKFYPEAMLREPYKNADIPCVGIDFKIVKEM